MRLSAVAIMAGQIGCVCEYPATTASDDSGSKAVARGSGTAVAELTAVLQAAATQRQQQTMHR